MRKRPPRPGQTVYLVASCRFIREAVVLRAAGGLYTIRFTDRPGAIRVRADRLLPSREAAEALVQQLKLDRQPIRPGYWHNVPLWQC